MNFEDHFSRHAAAYAQYRPQYPAELFAYLAGHTAEHKLAWDCATGSGQAARDLVNYYEQVVATDASAEQISRAIAHERIAYRVEPAEETSLLPGSVDLITVAVAVHWFDFDRFYAEVRRVLKDGGLIAVWTYSLPQIDQRLDTLLAYLDDHIIAGYWPERITYLKQRYQTLPFPFEDLAPPEFFIQVNWTMDQLLGFINSWSGVRRFEQERGYHPLKTIWEDFLTAWGPEDQLRSIRWRLHLRVGRVP